MDPQRQSIGTMMREQLPCSVNYIDRDRSAYWAEVQPRSGQFVHTMGPRSNIWVGRCRV